MRQILLVLALGSLLSTGCTTAGDHKTPVGMTRTTVSQRIAGQRLQRSQVPIGDVNVGGHLAE